MLANRFSECQCAGGPAADSHEAPADARTLRGFQVRHWTRDAMDFWAVSDLNDIELDQFVRALTP